MAKPKDYRSHIALRHRRPLGKIRTTKRPGDLEIVFDAKTGEYVPYRHAEPTAGVSGRVG